MRRSLGLIAIACLALTACDVIRMPGDGRSSPGPEPVIPEGAPGPQPPMTPVSSPYGDDDVIPDTAPQGEVTEPTLDTDPVDTPEPEPETPPVVDPEPEPLPIKFQYYAPGNLTPGSGVGKPDDTVYVPNMVFPIREAPTFPQSQVWRFGGGIGGGDQCDARNYEAPWQDNFCEQRSRTRNTPMCPTNKVHQGQDIRVGTAAGCNQLRSLPRAERTLFEAAAVEDGVIQYVGSYSIQLRGASSGNIYSYLHLNMAALKVGLGDTVTAGQSLGYVSNDFGGTPTTFHLHFEIKAPLEGEGITHVPPYMSLVKAYERREGGRGEEIEDDVVAVASLPTIPDGFEIIE